MDEMEKEFKLGFLDEAAQMLSEAEQCFLALESCGRDAGVIDRIFRLAHSLKGTSSAVGFCNLAEFTHQLESLLLKIKTCEIGITRPIVSLLLRCNDHLVKFISELRKDLNSKYGDEGLLADLIAAIEGRAAPGCSSPAAGKAGPPTVAAGDPEPEPEPARPGELPKPVPRDARANGAPGATDESIRVSLGRVERLMNSVGELVILQTVLTQQKHAIHSPLIQKTISQLAKITQEIQDVSMSLRMIPLKQTFQKMQRVVRDTSATLGKEVSFATSGEDSELDKTVLEQLGDPLIHLVRNAVDHGLESPEARARAGKPRAGTVRLQARHQGAHVVIEVQDDGGGIDASRIRAKAIEKGILREGQELSDREALQLVFHPGFSTKSEVTGISGRGVGLDVVQKNVERLQGEIQLETVPGQGTCFRILLPLTMAIIDGMVLRMNDERYVVPIAQVHECLQPAAEDVSHVSGLGEVLNLRGESIRMLPLTEALGLRSRVRSPTESIAVVIRNGAKVFSITVDEIVGQQQVVIKKLGREISGLKGVTGGAILGDGRAALILDLNELIKSKEAA